MKTVRLGVIGLGGMGKADLKVLKNLPTCEIVAICDVCANKMAEAKAEDLIGPDTACYEDYRELIASGKCDAVAVITPHPTHLEISRRAFAAGLHVMCDKPITVAVSDADQMLDAWRRAGTKFTTMYTMRTTSCNRTIREWIRDGKLGRLRRVEMTCSNWLRTQKYFDSQVWRGTWKGEGGGLLMNQAPHNLDLLYWWFGPARSISAVVAKRFHNIETEDEVSARIVTQDDVPISFYATTGEAPGKDYVEIVGDNGTLVRENDRLRFRKLSQPIGDFIRNSEEAFGRIPCEDVVVDVPEGERGHGVVFKNWLDAVLNGTTPLIAPGEDGVHAVEWANAMLLSHVAKREVTLPVDRPAYDALLAKFRAGELSL